MRLIDPAEIEMIVNVPESLISFVPHVIDIKATFDAYPGIEIPAEVTEIGTEPTETTRTYPVKLLLTPPPGVTILPGMAGRVRGKPGPEIARGSSRASSSPLRRLLARRRHGLLRLGGERRRAETAHRQQVTLGEPVVGGISVTNGLTPGNLVAAAGVHTLREGQAVRVLEARRDCAMRLPELAIRNRTFTLFAVFLVVLAGISAFFSLGQLEEPDFTIKVAVVSTPYPGATPEEVERDVTDRIESKLQELKQVDYLESSSQEGLSTIKVVIKPAYSSEQIPQVWNELRRKVSDVAPQLPKGAGPSSVGDDFGDVYGLLLAVTGDGYSLADLKRYATDLKKELSLVPGVARVALWGVQDRRIYLDASLSQLTAARHSEASLERAVAQQNAVAAAGSVTLARQRVPVTPSGQFPAPESVADLLVQASPVESYQRTGSAQRQGDLIRIGDFADLDLGYRDPPLTMMRYDGQPAIALAITNQPGVNVVELGKGVDARLAELVADLPVGIEVHRVHWQSALIEARCAASSSAWPRRC